ncbi:MAG: hypothetical protein PHU14_05390, partial [Methylovulum sp.]|nr:hypothetical protein [Methylovulum sp.]
MSAPVFNDIRTRRLTISLKELDIGNAIALARFPSEDFERTTTAFLNAVVKNCDGVADNLDWTVQERTLAVCQYLSANNGDTPDFALGYEGHYSDYLAAETDVELDTDGNLKTLALGLIGDDDWQLRPLTGRMAQAVERLRGEVTLPDGGELSGYAHWELGCMAAQLFLPGDSAPPDTDGLYDEWLVH